MEVKKNLRKELNARIAALTPEYVAESDAAILGAVLASDEYAAAQIIFTYAGVKNEVATLPLIEAALRAGKRVCVPLTYPGGMMDAAEIGNAAELAETPCGLFEPVTYNVITPENIDFILVPCLSCDPFGNRIGYGGGYYDRYLKRTAGARAYAAVRGELLSMHVPEGKNDIKVDGYFSESGLFKSISMV
ncbi:MAG: 5-formyltetrahydrofolate cyclo-ligase [Clostridiales Family XIII bacterium]|jgi:5-formyltetrahydrofolate cyclo-ligase|nr:5-formyltetrahydrofolate cyclo-ligase [Clostridiales Family XIII bacterium]